MDREREEARSSAIALRVANERLDAFLSMTGHELRTPLTNVKGFLQLAAGRMRLEAKRVAALTGELNATQQASFADLLEHARAPLAQAESESKLMQRLVDDILDAEQIRSGGLEIRPEPCDLVSIVRDAITTPQIRATGRKIILKAGDGSPIAVRADVQRIKQALSNYLNNALKYAPAERPIVVMIRAPVSSIPTLRAGSGQLRSRIVRWRRSRCATPDQGCQKASRSASGIASRGQRRLSGARADWGWDCSSRGRSSNYIVGKPGWRASQEQAAPSRSLFLSAPSYLPHGSAYTHQGLPTH